MRNDLEILATWLGESKSAASFTGAGMSTLLGATPVVSLETLRYRAE